MIMYCVPLRTYPAGYLDNPTIPLGYIGLAAQKNYLSLYLDLYEKKEHKAWFEKAFRDSGKKLDMGKSCVRFKKASDLPLDVIAEAVALTPVKEHIRKYEEARKR